MKITDLTVGQKVYYKKNSVDVYEVKKIVDMSTRKKMAIIKNVHGHEVYVEGREIYPYVEKAS